MCDEFMHKRYVEKKEPAFTPRVSSEPLPQPYLKRLNLTPIRTHNKGTNLQVVHQPWKIKALKPDNRSSTSKRGVVSTSRRGAPIPDIYVQLQSDRDDALDIRRQHDALLFEQPCMLMYAYLYRIPEGVPLKNKLLGTTSASCNRWLDPDTDIYSGLFVFAGLQIDAEPGNYYIKFALYISKEDRGVFALESVGSARSQIIQIVPHDSKDEIVNVPWRYAKELKDKGVRIKSQRQPQKRQKKDAAEDFALLQRSTEAAKTRLPRSTPTQRARAIPSSYQTRTARPAQTYPRQPLPSTAPLPTPMSAPRNYHGLEQLPPLNPAAQIYPAIEEQQPSFATLGQSNLTGADFTFRYSHTAPAFLEPSFGAGNGLVGNTAFGGEGLHNSANNFTFDGSYNAHNFNVQNDNGGYTTAFAHSAAPEYDNHMAPSFNNYRPYTTTLPQMNHQTLLNGVNQYFNATEIAPGQNFVQDSSIGNQQVFDNNLTDPNRLSFSNSDTLGDQLVFSQGHRNSMPDQGFSMLPDPAAMSYHGMGCQ